MGLFERYLTVWVGAAILVGVGLGTIARGGFEAVAALQVAEVNLVVAALIWLMIFPMMLGVDPSCIGQVGRRPQGLVLTLVINWLLKPFSMAALGILFFDHVFAGMIPEAEARDYVAGMILLGVAPCTAMVFVWSDLTKGDPNYTLLQVSVNDIILVFAFAPLAGLLLGVAEVQVPWATLVTSVVLFVVVPLGAGIATRAALRGRVERLSAQLKPVSVIALILTVVILFGLQAQTIIEAPLRVAMIAAPLTIQSYGIFALGYGVAWVMRLPHDVASPAAMIGTSNFFELAVAVAISMFGLSSGAALATVVGVLIEVPVMLSLVAFSNRTRSWFQQPTLGAP